MTNGSAVCGSSILDAARGDFRFGNLVVFQIQLAKHLAALPITRDYIAETEAMLNKENAPAKRRYSDELPSDDTVGEATAS